MSNNAANEKRAVLPKQLVKLNVALEREKSVKDKQRGSNSKTTATSAKKTSTAAAVNAKYAASSDSNQSSNAPSPETNSGIQTREKSPTKQQRNFINKVVVAASSTPMKRPASAPVKPTAKSSAGAKPARASVVGTPTKSDAKKSFAGQHDTVAKPIEVKPRKATLKSSSMDQQSDDEAGETTAEGGGALTGHDEEEPPARGHYDIFIQTRECEDVCLGLGLALKHIHRMKKHYDANDMYCTYVSLVSLLLLLLLFCMRFFNDHHLSIVPPSGEITQAEFFFMINEEERPISKGIFTFGGIDKDQKYISFDQYLLCVVQFASLTKPELFQYVFDLYDADRSGSLDEREFTKMSKELQSKQFCFPKNVDTAIKMLGGTDGGGCGVGTEDGLVDFAQFMKFARNFPVAFYPIANMQKNIRAATLGESFWSRTVARQLKIKQLLVFMHRNYGAIPDMTTRERIWSFFSDDIYFVRKRTAELYATEVAQHRQIGDTD